jgi:hypothetical protein
MVEKAEKLVVQEICEVEVDELADTLDIISALPPPPPPPLVLVQSLGQFAVVSPRPLSQVAF